MRDVKKRDLLGIAILVLGILAGLLLVRQSQEFRERAQWLETYKYILCHKTGSPDSPWKEIQVAQEELQEHLDHGDVLGECPLDVLTPPTIVPVKTPTPRPTRKPRPTPTLPQPEPSSPTPTLKEEEEPEEVVEIVPEGPASVDFALSFQALNAKGPTKKVRIEFVPTGGGERMSQEVAVESNSKGVYSATIKNVVSGNYEVLLNSNFYLQRKYSDVVISIGANIFGWTDKELQVGDFNSDSKITLGDVALMLGEYTQAEKSVTAENERFDVNYDGVFDLGDIEVVLGNLSHLEVAGE